MDIPRSNFTIGYDVARDIVHAARRAGSPIKAEQINQDSLMLGIGFLVGLAGQIEQQQGVMQELGNRMLNMLPEVDDDA